MWLSQNWFKVALIVLFSVSIAITSYYLFYFKPEIAAPDLKSFQNLTATSSNSTSTTTIVASNSIPAAKLLSAPPSTQNLSQALLKKIMSRIVLVKCYGGGNAVRGSGTAGLINSDDAEVITNFHVPGSAGGVSSVCTINIPNPPTYSPGNLYVAQVGAFDSHYSIDDPFSGVDVAVLHIEKVSQTDSGLFDPFPLPFCDEHKVQIGDKVTILGYPGIGGDTLTVTDGIISGFTQNNYGVNYKTSALIDHGVSGGLAIKNADSCVLGIPTWENPDPVNGVVLGYIQSWSSIANSGDIFKINTATPSSQTPVQPTSQVPQTTQPPAPVQQPSSQDIELAAEQYYRTNHTCIGLSGEEYDDCITYAYNH